MVVLIVAIGIMFSLLAGGLWIACAIGIGGVTSLWAVVGETTLPLLGRTSWVTGTSFLLIAIPLFIFMGEILSASGSMERLYMGLARVIHGLKGELVQTNIVACSIFAACTGSSVASAATIGRIAYPEMVTKRGYDRSFVLGSIAAGGTLGILIPPSIIMIIYGSMAEVSVGRLFMAGMVPGLIMAGLFMVYVSVRTRLQPGLVPVEMAQRPSLRDRLSGLVEVGPLLVVVLLVLGGIYSGLTTPTEAAGLGCGGAVLIAAGFRRLSWKLLADSARETILLTSMIFLILIAAKVMGLALVYYRIPPLLQEWGAGLGSPFIVFIIIVVFYLAFGCIFEVYSMVVITLPFILPLVAGVGFDLIWFGITLVILCEAGLLTPPIGLNLFILQGVTGASLSETAKGSVPFVIVQGLVIVLLYLWPQIALWLPSAIMLQ